jgi:iron-sulfur cluster assembly protein
MTVTMTEIAELRLRTFLRATATAESTVDRGIRLSIKDGGCSGYEYAIDVAETPQPGDLLENQGALRVYVDAQSASLLDGVVIDYVEGLVESGFKFTNPHATDTCGCGKSFRAGDCSPAGVPCS